VLGGIEEYPEAIYRKSDNGWMDAELLYSEHHIVSYVSVYHILTLTKFAEYCSKHGIILYCLLGNATHILKACDVGLFFSFEVFMRKRSKKVAHGPSRPNTHKK